VGVLERLVLHQRGLHQRIYGVGSLAQALHDRGQASGSGGAFSSLVRPVEKIVINWRSCGVMAFSLASK